MSLTTAQVAKSVFAAALLVSQLHAASAECLEEKAAKPKLLERTERGPQGSVNVLALPAKVAQWLSAQKKPEVVIGFTVKRPR